MLTEYLIEYKTKNTYEELVKESLYDLLVVPCQDQTQHIKSVSFENSINEEAFAYKSVFGFQATRFRSIKNFQVFELKMKALLEKYAIDFSQDDYFSAEKEAQMLLSDDFYIDNYLFLQKSPFTQISDDYLSKLLHFQIGKQNVLDYLNKLNEYIYQLIEFCVDCTTVHTTAAEVLELKKGVCQDYAHLFLAVARHYRIPCRYVSGYLNQGLHLHGDSVMHAWVEAYIPNIGWRGFDPTNNLIVNENHIKVCHGVDYSDCSPIKGVIKTVSLYLKQKTEYSVKVIPNNIFTMVS